jgi:hypothetical protein
MGEGIEKARPTVILPKKAGEDFKPHWIDGLPNNEYHAMRDYVSNTALQDALDSPAHFYWYSCLGNPRKETKAQELGTIIHAAILEPERYSKNLIVQPEFNLKSPTQRADLKAWRKNLDPEWIPVSASQRECVLRALDSVYKHPVLLGLLNASKKEVSGVFKEPHLGYQCRVRLDQIIPADRIVLDVKTSQDGSREAFTRSVLNYRYYFQAAFYLMGASAIEGTPFEQFYWVVAETQPPYLVELYPCDAGWLGCGDVDIQRALMKIEAAMRSNYWGGYQVEPTPLSPPNWFIQKDEYTTDALMEGLANHD